MAGFEDIIGAEDILGAEDIFGADIALGTEFGADYEGELRALLSGDIPIVGNGSSAMVSPSAARTAAIRRHQNKQQMLRHLAERHAAAVVPRPVTKAREYFLGFPFPQVLPAAVLGVGVAVTMTTQPQVPFRARRLILPSDQAGTVVVNDLIIGKTSMAASRGGAVPGRMFSEQGVGVDLNCDTAQISQQIILLVTNTSGAILPLFSAGIIGTAVE